MISAFYSFIILLARIIAMHLRKIKAGAFCNYVHIIMDTAIHLFSPLHLKTNEKIRKNFKIVDKF